MTTDHATANLWEEPGVCGEEEGGGEVALTRSYPTSAVLKTSPVRTFYFLQFTPIINGYYSDITIFFWSTAVNKRIIMVTRHNVNSPF